MLAKGHLVYYNHDYFLLPQVLPGLTGDKITRQGKYDQAQTFSGKVLEAYTQECGYIVASRLRAAPVAGLLQYHQPPWGTMGWRGRRQRIGKGDKSQTRAAQGRRVS